MSVLPNAPSPCLFMDRAGWEGLAAKLEDPYFKKLHENNLEALRLLDLEKYEGEIADVPWYLGRASRRCGIPDRVLKNRTIRAAAAFYITKDDRWLKFATETLDAACASDNWVPGKGKIHGVRGAALQTGDLLYILAFGYDVLFPYLTDEQKARYAGTLRDVGLPAYLNGLALHDWWERCDFNWGAALHGNAGLAALALRHDAPELAKQVLAEARERLKPVIANYHPGGGWIEGVMYQCTGIGHLTDFVMPLFRLTGDDLGLLANKNFLDTITCWQYLVGGDRRPFNFSNVSEATTEWGMPHAFWWADRAQRPDWVYFQQRPEVMRSWRDTHGCFYDVEAFWFRPMNPKAEAPKTSGLKHFAGIDWLTWHGPKTWLGLRSGFNGGNHNNKDLGHIILGHGEERFLVDPGYGAGQTDQHNAVTVRGFGQTDCSVAKIVRAEEVPGGFVAACDLSKCFPFSLEHFQRTLLMIDDTHLLVLDDLKGAQNRRTSARWHLQTRQPWTKDGDRIVLKGRAANLTVHLLSDTGYFGAKGWEFDGPISTLTWTPAYDRIHNLHPMLLTFGAPKIESRFTEAGFEISVDGKAWRYDAAARALSPAGRG
ncbi:MAG: heparinase II/III family protein [Planctomycetota bacterium]|nr:heparinase II/III family protein [Planctomycetota bacterium]